MDYTGLQRGRHSTKKCTVCGEVWSSESEVYGRCYNCDSLPQWDVLDERTIKGKYVQMVGESIAGDALYCYSDGELMYAFKSKTASYALSKHGSGEGSLFRRMWVIPYYEDQPGWGRRVEDMLLEDFQEGINDEMFEMESEEEEECWAEECA